MASNSKKTESIRKKKTKPNKSNLKADQKRFEHNAKRLKELAAADQS